MDHILTNLLLGLDFLFDFALLYLVLSQGRELRKIRQDRAKKASEAVTATQVSTTPHVGIPATTPEPVVPVQSILIKPPTASPEPTPTTVGVNSWKLILKGDQRPYNAVIEWSDGTMEVIAGNTSAVRTFSKSKTLHPIHVNGMRPHFLGNVQIEWELNGFPWS